MCEIVCHQRTFEIPIYGINDPGRLENVREARIVLKGNLIMGIRRLGSGSWLP